MASLQALDMSIKIRTCSIQELGEILSKECEFKVLKFDPHSKRILDDGFPLDVVKTLVDIDGMLKERERRKNETSLMPESVKIYSYFNEETKQHIQSFENIKYEKGIDYSIGNITPSPNYFSSLLSSISDKWKGLS